MLKVCFLLFPCGSLSLCTPLWVSVFRPFSEFLTLSASVFAFRSVSLCIFAFPCFFESLTLSMCLCLFLWVLSLFLPTDPKSLLLPIPFPTTSSHILRLYSTMLREGKQLPWGHRALQRPVLDRILLSDPITLLYDSLVPDRAPYSSGATQRTSGSQITAAETDVVTGRGWLGCSSREETEHLGGLECLPAVMHAVSALRRQSGSVLAGSGG